MEYPNPLAYADRDISPSEYAHMEGIPVPSQLQRQEMPDHEHHCCEESCPSCREQGWGLDAHPLAMVYAPCQAFRHLYDPDTAINRGTLFSELDLPLEVALGTGGCGCGQNSRSSSCRKA